MKTSDKFKQLLNLDEKYVIWPTSCSCGGNYAWFKQTNRGSYVCIGCVCHTSIDKIYKEEFLN
jgi:hypothetical protein